MIKKEKKKETVFSHAENKASLKTDTKRILPTFQLLALGTFRFERRYSRLLRVTPF